MKVQYIIKLLVVSCIKLDQLTKLTNYNLWTQLSLLRQSQQNSRTQRSINCIAFYQHKNVKIAIDQFVIIMIMIYLLIGRILLNICRSLKFDMENRTSQPERKIYGSLSLACHFCTNYAYIFWKIIRVPTSTQY